MENASKALIIAGAILISILLIGVGVLIYQNSLAPIEEAQSQMDDQAKSMFNSKFDSYIGNKVKGSSVRMLISKVQTSNSTSVNKIDMVDNGASEDNHIPSENGVAISLNGIDQTKYYTVTAGYLNGVITSIGVKAN